MQQQSMESEQELLHVSTSMGEEELPTKFQLTRIFSAAMGALIAIFFFFLLLHRPLVDEIIAMHAFLSLSGQVVMLAAVLIVGVILSVGIPLAIVAWRSTPRIRFLLATPFLAVVLPIFALILFGYGAVFMSSIVMLADIALIILAWRTSKAPRLQPRMTVPFVFMTGSFAVLLVGYLSLFPFFSPIGEVVGGVFWYSLPVIGHIGNLLAFTFIFGAPIMSTIIINRAMREATIPDKWLRFARLPMRILVFSLVVMFLGLLFWGSYLLFFAPEVFFRLLSPLHMPWNSWSLILGGVFISLFVTARTFIKRY